MTNNIRLSPVDHLFTGQGAYPINFIFFYPASLDGRRLKASLDEVLSVYTPCAARLKTISDSQQTYYFDESQTSPCLWEERRSQINLANQDLSELEEHLQSVKSSPGEALLSATLTHFPLGSALAVSLSHCVVDGYSYFMFLNDWAKVYRNEECGKPQLNRDLLLPENFSAHTCRQDTDSIQKHCGFAWVAEERPGDQSAVRWQVTHYSKTELDKLYQDHSRQTQTRLSVNDVLSAELWRKFSRQEQEPRDDLSFACAYDFRRTYSRIGADYFGNAIRAASVNLSFEDLQERPAGEVATLLSRAVKSIDQAAVEESLSCLECLRRKMGFAAMQRFHVAHPKYGFLVTNLSRLPLMGLDFGAGPPQDFRILTPAKRTSVILPAKDGLRVQTAL